MANKSIGGDVPARDFAALFLLATLWGSSFLVIKISLVTIPPMTLVAIRLFVAMVFLWGVLLIKNEPFPNAVKAWGMCFLIGFFGNALPFYLISWGEEVVESGLTAVLMAVMPLSTVVMAHFFTEGDRITPQRMIGIGIGFLGIIILVGPSVLAGLGEDAIRQIAIAMAATSYGLAAIIARNMPPGSVIGRSVAIMICGFFMMLPFALWFDQPWTLEPSYASLLGAAYLGVMSTAVASLIYLYLIAERGASFMAFINYLVPILGVIWGAIILGEEITLQVLAALGAILVGLFIANYRRNASQSARS